MRRLMLPLFLLALTVSCADSGTKLIEPTGPDIDIFEVNFDRIGTDSARFTVYVKASDPNGPDDKVLVNVIPSPDVGAFNIPWQHRQGFSPHYDTIVAALPEVQTEVRQRVYVQDEEGLASSTDVILNLPPRG